MGLHEPMANKGEKGACFLWVGGHILGGGVGYVGVVRDACRLLNSRFVLFSLVGLNFVKNGALK